MHPEQRVILHSIARKVKQDRLPMYLDAQLLDSYFPHPKISHDRGLRKAVAKFFGMKRRFTPPSQLEQIREWCLENGLGHFYDAQERTLLLYREYCGP